MTLPMRGRLELNFNTSGHVNATIEGGKIAYVYNHRSLACRGYKDVPHQFTSIPQLLRYCKQYGDLNELVYMTVYPGDGKYYSDRISLKTFAAASLAA
jgi:hypothetical protein